MKKVSAIITTHNRSGLLRRAIDSVLNQTYKNIECIVVDDNSTDDTREICSYYPVVQYIFIPKEESRGGNHARNVGIMASVGMYCAFLDDDDYWLPTKIEKQVELIEQLDCELVYCGRRLEIVKAEGVDFKDDLPDSRFGGDMHKKILWGICTTTTNILVKKDALIDIGMFDEDLRFWQEYELTIRLAQRKPFYFVNEPLSVYRIDKSDSQRLTNKFFEWKKTVKYIQKKHSVLYDKLNCFEKLMVLNNIWSDAAVRSKASGLKFHYIRYRLATIPFIIFEKVKGLRKE